MVPTYCGWDINRNSGVKFFYMRGECFSGFTSTFVLQIGRPKGECSVIKPYYVYEKSNIVRL